MSPAALASVAPPLPSRSPGPRDAASVAQAVSDVLRAKPSLPLPGRGKTLERWRALHAVAQSDLVVAKLVEPHWDAQAILADLAPDATAAGDCWAVWAAEAPDAVVRGTHDATGQLRLTGRKAWCSGATLVTHALVTYVAPDGRRGLAALALNAAGVSVTNEGWHAVGMDATASVDVVLTDAPATAVGSPGQYLDRPGFWQGGMGIAACWLGGASALANAARDRVRTRPDPHALAHIGALDIALEQTYALMRETAAWVDAHPTADARWPAFRLRSAAEACVDTVLHHAGRVLGAGPLCREAHLARLYADLPIFIRQSHAERDLAALGSALTEDLEPNIGTESAPWTL